MTYIKKLHNENFIAHFTSEKALFKILDHRQIKFSPVSNVNDPFEYTTDLLLEDPSSGEAIAILDYRDLIKEKLGNQVKLFCGSNYNGEKHSLEELYYGCPLMWSHYANYFEGVCLIFDRKIITSALSERESEFYYLKEQAISYEEYFKSQAPQVEVLRGDMERLSNDDEFLCGHFKTYFDSHYFKKTTCWEIENEYRWLIFTKNNVDFYLEYKNALKAVIIGPRQSNYPKILQRIKRYQSRDQFDVYYICCNDMQYQIHLA